MRTKLLREGAFTILGQALLSIASFATTIYLGRGLTPDDYAVFVLANSLVLTLQGGHRGVFTIPFSVTSRRFNELERSNYNGSTLLHTLSYCLTIGLFVAVAMQLKWPAPNSQIWEQKTLIISLFIWLVTFIFRQHLRACLLAELNVKKVFNADLISSLLQIVGLAWLQHYHSMRLTEAVIVLILASLLPSLYMQHIQRHLTSYSIKKLLPHLRTSWKTGKWYLGNTVLFSISSQSIPWLLLLFTTKKEVAALGICMSSVSILSPLLRGVNAYLLPKITSDYHHKGAVSIINTVKKASIIVSGPYLLFFVATFFYGNNLLAVLFNDNYANYGNILTIIAGKALIESVSTPVSVALQALELPRLITISQISAAGFMLLVGIPIIYFYGLTGAAISSTVGAIVSFVIKLHFYQTAMVSSEKRT